MLPVLIVGSGPTGLVLALWLQRYNVPFRIIEATPKRSTGSRALVLHARTLEFYRQLGVVEQIVAASHVFDRFVIHSNKTPKATIHNGSGGKTLSKYPFSLSLSQDRHEEVLEEILRQRGARVEYGVRLEGCTQLPAGEPGNTSGKAAVLVNLADSSTAETVDKASRGELGNCVFSYVAGCDGARSAVRAACSGEGGITMQGGTYERRFFVADVNVVEGTFPFHEIHVCLTRDDFIVMIPISDRGNVRLIGRTPEVPDDEADRLTFDDVRGSVAHNTNLQLAGVNWFSHYKVHHRVASKFRHRNAFVVGDAAHLHSPVGGQGMNTGIGDATNLAWKLAAVAQQEKIPDEAKSDDGTAAQRFAPDDMLDTYETERIKFANLLVKTTDQVFSIVTGNGLLGLIWRSFFFPVVVPWIVRVFNITSLVFQRTSQIAIEYAHSPLSGSPSAPKGAKAGGRLPWVEDAVLFHDGSAGDAGEDAGKPAGAEIPTDNFSVLQSTTWQLHVYADAPRPLPAPLHQLCRERGIETHAFKWSPSVERAGLLRDVAYLVRPDGHIGTALNLPAPGADVPASQMAELQNYCSKWGVGRMGLSR